MLWLRDSPEGETTCEQRDLRSNLRYTYEHLREALKVKGLFVLTAGHAFHAIAFWGLSLWMPTFLLMARGFDRTELIWAAALPYTGFIAGLVVGSTLSDRTGQRSVVTGVFCASGAAVLVAMTYLTGRAETLAALTALFFFIALLGPNVATLLQGCCTSRLTCSATGIENGIANGLGALGPILTGAVVALTGSYDAALVMLAALLLASGVVILRFRTYESAACPIGEKDYLD